MGLKGIIFQSDAGSIIGAWVIRPLEGLDRRIAGLHPSGERQPIAMHAGLHVELEDGHEYVAEQLVGSAYKDLKNGLNWTPIEAFRERDRGGWDVTVPASAMRGVDERVVADTIERLNVMEGKPFFVEDCTDFIERAFGERQLFADSPTLRSVGIRGRLGDPALPLLRRDVRLDDRTWRLLRADRLRKLPDPGEGNDPPSARIWAGRVLAGAALTVLAAAAMAPLLRRTSS